MSNSHPDEGATERISRKKDTLIDSLANLLKKRTGTAGGSLVVTALTIWLGPSAADWLNGLKDNVDKIPAVVEAVSNHVQAVSQLSAKQAALDREFFSFQQSTLAVQTALTERLQRDEDWLKSTSQRNAEMRETLADLKAEVKILKAKSP